MQDLVARLAERLHTEAEAVVAQAQERFQVALHERNQALEQARQEAGNLSAQLQRTETVLQAERGTGEALRREMASRATDLAQLEERIAGLTARLAEHAGIAVVADFRSRDVAAGGQGAPLVPAFHAARFGCGAGRAVLNLGGIANLTVLEDPVRGFDTGPANMLMDAWARRHLGQPYDRDGAWAARGRRHDGLLAALLAEPWLDLAPPKSTGRDLFSLAWLDGRLDALPADTRPEPADVQATLLCLSVETIAAAVRRHAPGTREILACGGGARNPVFMAALARALPCRLTTTDACGVPAQDVEALAFAWLAQAHIQGRPACLPAVTGARRATIAGCLYPV